MAYSRLAKHTQEMAQKKRVTFADMQELSLLDASVGDGRIVSCHFKYM